jgi:hypothetical protein
MVDGVVDVDAVVQALAHEARRTRTATGAVYGERLEQVPAGRDLIVRNLRRLLSCGN